VNRIYQVIIGYTIQLINVIFRLKTKKNIIKKN